ncbi:MAG: DNA mismatch repair protein MutS [Clostridiales bacterium]|jgi:DNA mismatch repair protein MutS|nr:DNA mismatch repair protein MutS [Clostridiales bacterium]
MGLTPMMQQYLAAKEQYKDTILLYRLGDFYEMFFDDAVTVSRELELTLTGRDCGLKDRAPMCGVPYHAAETYIARLIEKGYKVAVCEQLTKPGEQKGIVKREIVRVVTPGTKMDAGMLDERANNYIAAVYLRDGAAGVSWADISTGELSHAQFDAQAALCLNELLSRVNPAEIICNAEMLAESVNLSLVKFGEICPFSAFDEAAFDYENAVLVLKEQLADWRSLNGKRLCVSAAGALLTYVEQTQKRKLGRIFKAGIEDETGFVQMDRNARRTLELTVSQGDGLRKGSLLWYLDRTKTAMGARLLKQWVEMPLCREDAIRGRQDAVAFLLGDARTKEALGGILSGMFDVSRLAGRAAYGNLTPRDCRALGESLGRLARIKEALGDCPDPLLRALAERIDDLSAEAALIARAILESPAAVLREGGVIADGFDQELDEYRQIQHGSQAVLKKMEADARAETGIKTLKIAYNRVFGYYIEVSKSQTESVPYRYIRRQTIANGERYVTEELKELESRILNAEDLAKQREQLLYDTLLERINERTDAVLSSARAAAEIDCLLSFAEISEQPGFVRPLIKRGGELKITEGRHCVVEKLLKNERFTPNDTFLDGGESRTMLITGPNMAGKSIYMRQVALIVILAQTGCYVPAQSAEIALVDRIFTRVGASDDLATGRSTFMVEMSEVAYILERATDNSLLLLDEIGRGTATFDGLSIAWAIIEYITKNLRAKTLFSTHYHELTELEGQYDGLKNYKMAVREDKGTIRFMRKLLRGSANKSFGIEVAGMAGIPEAVLTKAREIYKKLEKVDIARQEKEDINYQLSIFSGAREEGGEVVTILRELKMEDITPKKALDILYDLKEKVEG